MNEESKNFLRTKKELIKNFFIEWCLSSTSHGLPNIFRTRRLSLKIIWLIFFVCSTSFGSYMVMESVIDFLNFDVVTKIRLIHEKPIPFPAVTICNLNPFVTNYSKQYILNFFSRKYNKTVSNYSDLKTCVNSIDDLNEDFVQIRQKAANETDYVKQSFGFKKEEIFILCTILTNDCDLNDFEWYYDTALGNCFKINSGYNLTGHKIPVFITNKIGNVNGVDLELFIGFKNDDLLYSYQPRTGVRVFVHNQTVSPKYNEGIDVQAGKCTNLVIHKTRTVNKEDPFSDCQNLDKYDSFLFNFIKNSRYSYRQQDCMEFCYQLSTYENCDCYDLDVPKLYDVKPCFLNETDYKCMWSNFRKFVSPESKNNCNKECPLECEAIKYELKQSFSDFPSRAYLNELNLNPNLKNLFNGKTLDLDDIKQSMVCLTIYFDEFKYTSITEQEKTSVLDLVAVIGGTLGLFIGISILSIVEIGELIIELLFIIFEKNNKIDSKTNCF